jgi:hypothetical protein
MKKLSTLFEKDPNDLNRVINKINPVNEWVYENGIPTRKFDGTSCAIIGSELYKRYDAKIDKETGKYKKQIPLNAIPCQEPDLITGHHPHWIKCDRSDNSNKYHFEAFDSLENKEDGTYELCGEKVQRNPENIKGHILIKHGIEVLEITNFTFENIRNYLADERNDIEGIVFHSSVNDNMCKIRKSDFGIRR